MRLIHKRFFLLITAVLLIYSVNSSALSIEEKTFKDTGFQSFSVNEPEKTTCFNVSFIKPDVNADEFIVLSLHYEFSPTYNGKAKIDLNINNEFLKEIIAGKEKCNSNCWKRIILKNLTEKENTLKICLNSGNTIPIIKVFNDSMIGIYKMPLFEEKNFIKTVSNATPYAGEKIKVKISFKNTGSEDAVVKVRHVKEFVEERRRKEVKEIGNTYFEGLVKAGEEKSFEYRVLVVRPTKMTLPAAVLSYENAFGEETLIESNEINLTAREPEEKVTALIKLIKINGNKATAELIVKNNSKTIDFHDVRSFLDLSQGLKAEKIEFDVNELKANESIKFPLELTASKKGAFIASCHVVQLETLEKTNCEKTMIEFKEKELDLKIIFGAIIALIGGLIYVYFLMQKE